ncbi:MAG: pentapeptide repeat-containing protein [Saprospiraceae bacterium]|nr:pentapeptide repeat-containing protein [Saprospiraceae bacterium]
MLQSKSIGNKIAAARKRINLSQAELAEQICISSQAVGKWERGESMPDISTLNRLAEILGVDLNYFSDKFPSVSVETSMQDHTTETESSDQVKKRSWDMSRGNWVNADFSGLKNLREKFGSSNMKNCKFIGSEMSGLVLKANHVDACDFSNSDLSSSKIQASHLINNLFKECSLKAAQFSSSHIQNCNFFQTDFTGSTFKTSSFIGNIIEGSIWNAASFISSDISNVVFEGKVEDCSFEYCSFSKVTFKNATLKNTFFKCRSLKRLQFIDCQADRMTYEFLKNGKADLKGISLITE